MELNFKYLEMPLNKNGSRRNTLEEVVYKLHKKFCTFIPSHQNRPNQSNSYYYIYTMSSLVSKENNK